MAQAILASWSVAPGLMTVLVLLAALYARGWHVLRHQMPERFPVWRLACFLGGLASVHLAIASPIDAFAGLLLQVHMLQHLLLMMVAPPLLLLGAPAIPLLRGLPPRFAKSALGPFLAWPALQRFTDKLLHPVTCWCAFVAATWLWHLPALYQLALRSPGWHAAEHATFLVTALLFWWPVVQPWPSRACWPRWTIPVYLLLADVQNTIFSALLVFSEHLFYPIYASVPRLGGISPLDDQVVAGVIMWVPGSVVFLVPTVLITVRLLSPRSPAPRPAVHRVPPAPRLVGDVLPLPVRGAAPAARPSCGAGDDAARRCGGGHRRTSRAGDEPDEPRRCAAVDRMAGAHRGGAPGRRQCLLLRVPVHAAARAGAPDRRTGP